MKRDYPEEEELQKVREWEGLNDPKGLIDFIGSIWHWDDPYFDLKEEENKWLLELHTERS